MIRVFVNPDPVEQKQAEDWFRTQGINAELMTIASMHKPGLIYRVTNSTDDYVWPTIRMMLDDDDPKRRPTWFVGAHRDDKFP